MNINEIKDLIKLVSESDITVLDFEEGNMRITLRKDVGAELPKIVAGKVEEKTVIENNEHNEVYVMEQPSQTQEVSEGNIVKSPLVGTVYLSGEEGGEPFVQVGDTVKKGQTLAIVEAMKLMNEIESEYDGVVKQVLIENEQPVEYGQPMFVIG